MHLNGVGYLCAAKTDQMNFNLSQIPERTAQPRTNGITMVMDKGLSVEEAKNFMSVAYP
ncbi:MAG: hypothetical protein RLY16_2055, partial [Bacteroidota bacterium]